MSRKTHAPSKCSVGGSVARGGADDGETHQVEDEFEQVSRGRYEKPLVRVARNPGDPTHKEVEEHNVTHLPHFSWCPVCLKASGKEEAHKKVREQGGVPTVSMDYMSFGDAFDGGR